MFSLENGWFPHSFPNRIFYAYFYPSYVHGIMDGNLGGVHGVVRDQKQEFCVI